MSSGTSRKAAVSAWDKAQENANKAAKKAARDHIVALALSKYATLTAGSKNGKAPYGTIGKIQKELKAPWMSFTVLSPSRSKI